LAMAFLDRIVDGAIILKIKGKSYRAHRAQQPTAKQRNSSPVPIGNSPPCLTLQHPLWRFQADKMAPLFAAVNTWVMKDQLLPLDLPVGLRVLSRRTTNADWLPGTVLEVDDTEVLIEYTRGESNGWAGPRSRCRPCRRGPTRSRARSQASGTCRDGSGGPSSWGCW
jgi:hypothetical protein